MQAKGLAKTSLLDAGVALIRQRGLSGSSVDDLCRSAGVTKGAFFHHFASKDDFAVAVAHHWGATTSVVFADADYHLAKSPLDRVLGYVDLREQMIEGTPAEYSCAAGTMTQEAFATSVAIRDACAAAIFDHAASLEADLAAALEQAADPGAATPGGLARYTQTVLQGSFILAKASDDPSVAREAIQYLRDSLRRILEPVHTSSDRRRGAASQEEP